MLYSPGLKTHHMRPSRNTEVRGKSSLYELSPTDKERVGPSGTTLPFIRQTEGAGGGEYSIYGRARETAEKRLV